MLYKYPKCHKCELGYIYFKFRTIKSPIKTVAHLEVTDLVCNKCNYTQKNTFKQKFNFTNEQIKKLILDFGECTISEFEDKYPCNSADVFIELCCEQELKKRGENK